MFLELVVSPSSEVALTIKIYPLVASVSLGGVTRNVVVSFVPASRLKDDPPSCPQLELPPKDKAISSSPLPSFVIIIVKFTCPSGSTDIVSSPIIDILGSKFCKTVVLEV